MPNDWEEKVKKDFIIMNDNIQSTLVIIEPNHPLYEVIVAHHETRSVEDALASFTTYDLVIDLSALRTKNKITLLKELAKTTKAEIITDLTLTWGEMVLKSCPQVIGAVSLLFYSPTTSVEYYTKSEKSKNQILAFLKSIERHGVEHLDLKLGFHYPRVISMIINEAYFALEENLAIPSAIDLAMKNGVNYPLGPIEWGQKIGTKYIVDLLTEYSEITEDPRYRISKELKMNGKNL
jgi:3-hydroxybutyryl-CoA dehydrogenase